MSATQLNLSYHLKQLCDKLARQLKAKHLQAQEFFIALKIGNHSWQGQRLQIAAPTANAKSIFRDCKQLCAKQMPELAIVQIQLSAIDANNVTTQLELFAPVSKKIYVKRELTICNYVQKY